MQEQITLNEVKQAFEQWRAVKLYRRERTPKELRAQVKAIAPYYPKRQILNALAINEEQLDRYVAQNKITDSCAILNDDPSNEFIEVPIMTQPKSASSQVLTITRGDGSSWALVEAPQEVISESLRLFLRG